MNDLLGLLMNQLGGSTTDVIAKAIGQDNTIAKKGIDMALPLILNQLTKNAKTESGLSGLFGALDKHTNSSAQDAPDLMDGAKILGHLFGNKQDSIQQQVAKQTGLDSGGAMKLLAGVASKVMGGLGQQKKSGGLDVGSLLGALTSSSKQATEKSSFANDLIYKMLDQDGDGSIMDDAMKMGGNLLKGMFS